MASHKSAAKRARQSVRRNERNNRVRSNMRTVVKKAVSAPADAANIQGAIREVQKAASKGVIPKRQAARRVSRLMKAHNKAAAAK